MRKYIRQPLLTASIILSIISTIPLTANSARAQDCQCTNYVANRFGLSGDYPHAGDWNDGYLQRNGFSRVNAQPGAVVVMERTFPGSDSNYGHVGVVERISANGKIEVRGANQSVGGSPFSESGCSNVRVTGFGTSINGRNDISFWAKTSSTNSQTDPTPNIHSVNFSAKAAPIQIKIRRDPSTKNQPVGFIEANQPISFDAWTHGEVVPDYWTNQPDARWYRIAGTNNWVSSAVVAGNAPGSNPMP